MAALLPVHYSTSPGRYSVTLTLGAQTETLPLPVDPKAFETQHLTVSQSTLDSTVNSQKANAEYNQKITPLKSVSDPVLHGSGSFIMPVQGEITTEFGLLRYTNDDPTPTRHGGIDIASDRGTPVMAAQRGRVLFSAYIDLTGNTILLEHGFGLKTWYYHMDSLAVQSGDMVEQGQCIGCVGSTGFSTGPHLHFAASVGAVYVNPWTLMADGLKLS
jgi:murein DD-endopeptidase MepM/ murein hydrolase activator NlpD